MKKLLLIILILTKVVICLAHQDFYVKKEFKNVTVRIKTGFGYEEINKTKILGELAQYLLNEMSYGGKVFIDFRHAYTDTCKTEYFVSYDDGSIKYTFNETEYYWNKKWHTWNPQKFTINNKSRFFPTLNSRRIVIRIYASNIRYSDVLQILEHSVKNKKYIKRNQLKIKDNRLYVNSVDSAWISDILIENESPLVSKVLNKKVYVNDSTWTFGASYYYQNKSFNFIVRSYNNIPDTLALSVQDIYQMTWLGTGSKVVFDTDSSFYYVGRYGDRVVSKRHIIENTQDNYEIFYVKDIGDDMISISFSRFSTEEEAESGLGNLYYSQTCIYDYRNDIMISDIRRNIIEK